MLKSFTVNGQMYQVTFRLLETHRLSPETSRIGCLEPITEVMCYIDDAAALQMVARGLARCSADDDFNFTTGGWLALSRAMDDAEARITNWTPADSERIMDALRDSLPFTHDDTTNTIKPLATGHVGDVLHGTRGWIADECAPVDWDDIDSRCMGDRREDEFAAIDADEIIDWHRVDAIRLGITPSTPAGELMTMYDYHRVFQALKARRTAQ